MNNPFRDLYLAELTKKQKVLDVDKDNKIEKSDLAKLRKEDQTPNAPDNAKPTGKGGKVETKKYSWGTMKTVHHGSDFSIPLHPEHHQAIAKLKDQQEHKFKDETGRHWTAKKSGEHVHFQGANNGGSTHVPAHTMHEEVEHIEEAKPGLYANINAKRKRIEAGSKERMRKPGSEGAPSAKDFKDAAKTANENYDDNRRGFGKRPREDDEYHVPDPTVKKTKVKNFSVKKEETLLSRIAEAAKKKACSDCGKMKCGCMNEEVLDEANHREFASQGKMHPDMAKHMSVGSEHDYYEHGTGDKVSGKVMHKSATEVHMKQTHDSYDPKKKGTVHKFKISDKLDEETISEGEGYTIHSKHTEADGTTTIVLKSPSGQMVTHKGKGSAQAVKQKYGIQAEETELDEKINMKKAEMGDVIKDFEKSDAPQFKGKSAEKRRQMAIAAKLSNEETNMNSFKSYMQEDLDEAAWPGTPEYKAKFGDTPTRGKVGSTSKTAKGTQTVTGTGVKHERDYEKAEKETSTPENQEKRGRGRPKGAASGARQKGSAAKSDDRYDSTGYKLHLPNKNR
jgi:hypothetical protein